MEYIFYDIGSDYFKSEKLSLFLYKSNVHCNKVTLDLARLCDTSG